MTAAAAPPDAGARARAVDPGRSVIVQAPAGSGKTSLLVERFLRLLARVDEPEQVVAITFTRKAAAEMRERVAAAIASGSTVAASAREGRLFDAAQAARARAAARGWQLDEQPSRLRILTIDAFTHWLAGHQPLTAGPGGGLEPADDATPLYHEAAYRTLAALESDAELAPALTTLIRLLNGDAATLVRHIATLLARRELWLPRLLAARPGPERRAATEQLLAAVLADELEAIRAELPSAAARRLLSAIAEALELTPDGSPLEVLRGLSELPPAEAGALSQWRALAGLVLTKDGAPRQALRQPDGFPPAARRLKQQTLEQIDAIAGDATRRAALHRVRKLPPAQYTDAEWHTIAALYEVLLRAAAELQQVFAARGRVDHAAVAAAAREALGQDDAPGDLALALDHRIRHLLVDEFQDTSAAQAALLRRLVAEWRAGEDRSLFCVGDPMQSIYGFREADVTLFLEARHEGLGGVRLEHETLCANFRSAPAVIDWVNASFAELLPRRDDFERGAIAYTPCIATQPASGADGVHLHAFLDTDAVDGAARVVDLVRRALEGAEGGTPSVAILVRSRLSLPPVLAALGRAGIGYRGVDLETLADRMAMRDLLALTRALLHAGDRTAWLAVLRAPWCGLTLADLHTVARAATGTIRETVAASEGLPGLSADGARRLHALRTALEPVLLEAGRLPLGSWVQSAWLALGGPATLAEPVDLDNARRCFAALDRLEGEGGPMPEASAVAAALARVQAAPSGRADARVEVMTIHRAKGLEFDIVILPDLDREGGSDPAPLLQWQSVVTRRGVRGLLLAPRGPKGGIGASRGAADATLHSWLCGLESERRRFELGRLAYVAATRARRQLHLIGNAMTKVDGDGVRSVRPPQQGSLLALLWPVVERSFLAQLEEAAGTPAASSDASPAAAAPLTRLRCPGSPAVALPEVPQAALALPAAATGVIRPAFDWAGEVASHVGTLLHAEFHRICRGELTLETLDCTARAAFWRGELLSAGLPAELLPGAIARIRSALRITQADPFGRRLLSRDWPEHASEVALSGIVDGRLVSVRIDRSCVDEDGHRWIVDWKSSWHEGADLEPFLQSELERYAPQLRLYARLMQAFDPRPARIGLYFPLLGQWREYLPRHAPPGSQVDVP